MQLRIEARDTHFY